MPGLVHRAPDWEALVGALAHRWSTEPLPPFGTETVIVSSPGAGRLLRQDLAHAIGEGICAGARFLTIGSFRRELDPVVGPDPWRHRTLALAIMEVLPGLLDDPAFALVAHHLGERGDPGRPGRWAGFARRFAATLLSYAAEQPGLVRAWSRGDEVDPHGEVLGESRWQCLLWRALREAAPTPDPVSRHDLLLPRLSQMSLPGRLQVVAPQPLPPLDTALLRALAEGSGLECYVIGDQEVAWLPGARLVQMPGRTPRPHLAVHVSHGTYRQIEVLRDALCGVFEDDPSLEPRDVVIQCADLPRYAPGIAAAFAPLPLGHAHPGRQLRVGLAAASVRRGNDVALTLSELLRLPDSRARLDDLLGLAALPPVARRFGFTAEALSRIGELASSAGVRWGIDAAHRARFGLEVSQNTWLAGLDRLLAGLVLPDDESVWLGTLTPSEAVGSSDADHLGQLAELVSRVRWFAHVSATPRTLRQWTQLLREVLNRMVATEPDTEWMLQEVLAELASLDEQTGDSAVVLGRAELSSLFGHLVPERVGRPNYGNGSLLVTSLGDLADVGFRVVCLLGADQPDEGPVLGDRLAPPGDDTDAHRQDRWLRAASAASDHVLVVYQGTNERTGEALPPPVAVQRLHDHARSVGWEVSPPQHHTLHAHAAANFDPDAPVSFDPGLARARAVPAPDPVIPGPAPGPPAPAQIELAELVRFIAHPASYYLRHTLGLAEVSVPAWPADLPIQPSGLDRWAIGDRMLARARRGESLETLMQAEWRRGTVGPGELGRSVLESVASQISAILDVAAPFDGPDSEHQIGVEAGGVRVVGWVRTSAGMLTQTTFSKTDDRAWIETWWRLVAASAAGLRPRGGVVVGSPDYSREIPARVTSRLITPPPVADALTLLTRLVETYVAGLAGPVPLPRRAARDLAMSLRARRYPPEPHRLLQIVERGWRYGTDADWLRFYPDPAALLSVPGTSGECRFAELSRLLYLPMIEATQVVPHA